MLTANGAVFKDHQRQTAVDDQVGLERTAHISNLRQTSLERKRLAGNAHFSQCAQRFAVVGVQTEIAVHGKAQSLGKRDVTDVSGENCVGSAAHGFTEQHLDLRLLIV